MTYIGYDGNNWGVSFNKSVATIVSQNRDKLIEVVTRCYDGSVQHQFPRIPIPNVEATILNSKGYLLDIRCLQDNIARPKMDVTLWASEPVPMRVNGSHIVIDADPYQLQANDAGVLHIAMETDSLDSHSFYCRTAAMPSNEHIKIQPNAYLRDRIRTTSTESVKKVVPTQ